MKHHLFAILAALSILACAPSCQPLPNTQEEPAPPTGDPIFQHWALEVNPYEYPSYSIVQVQLQASASDKTLLPLDYYEIAAINNEGKVAGFTTVTSDTQAEMNIFGDSGDEFTFRLWDCRYHTERTLRHSYSLTNSEEITLITLY